MPYSMAMYVSGGCRRAGQQTAIGAAACVTQIKSGRNHWAHRLPDHEYPNIQKAGIFAIVIALKLVLEKYGQLRGKPHMEVTIYTDSDYVYGCMTVMLIKWLRNGWRNFLGDPVANRELLQRASDLEDAVMALGSIRYVLVPRGQNREADEAVNSLLDEMEGGLR